MPWCERTELHIDHCHDTGAVRGLLCLPHNISLGNLGDRVETVSQALDYLKDPPAPKVLLGESARSAQTINQMTTTEVNA